MANTKLNYLTHKVGGPDCNTAVEKLGHKPDTQHIEALPLGPYQLS